MSSKQGPRAAGMLKYVGWEKRSVPTMGADGGHVANAPLPTLHTQFETEAAS